MTITKEFCEQYVSLIPRPHRYLTEWQMIGVVENGTAMSLNRWFNDKQIVELSTHNRVFPQIYAFIRDNQNIWS